MLSDYLDTIREIERRIQKMEAHDLSHVNVPNAPAGTPPQFEQHISLMFDLIALAYQANMTRVFSMMMAAEVSNLTYNQIGVPDAFHPLVASQQRAGQDGPAGENPDLSHRAFSRSSWPSCRSMPDGDGNMLDHSMILYGSNMSNSNLHNHYPLPTALVGGWKTVKGGQHLKYPDQTPLANMLLTVLDRAGVPLDHFGDSSGKFAEV